MIQQLTSIASRTPRSSNLARSVDRLDEFVAQFIDEVDELALETFFDDLAVDLIQSQYPSTNNRPGYRSHQRTSFYLNNVGASLLINVMRHEDSSRLPFDMGLLLHAPKLNITHALMLEGRRLKPDAEGQFTHLCQYEPLTQASLLEREDSCRSGNFSPRSGQILFYNPERVENREGGVRLMAPELVSTLNKTPDFNLVLDESRRFSDFIVHSFLRGYRGTPDSRVVNIVTNQDKMYYTKTILMLTLKSPC